MSKANFSELLQGKTPVLIDFSAEWCGPCKMLSPILKELKNDLGNAIKIVKIDVDKNQQLAARYRVQGVPTLILFKEGNQVWRQSGVVPKDQLLNIIKPHQ